MTHSSISELEVPPATYSSEVIRTLKEDNPHKVREGSFLEFCSKWILEGVEDLRLQGSGVSGV